MKVSCYTWVKDWPDIAYTLPINIHSTSGKNVEFCIADCGSTPENLDALYLAARGVMRVTVKEFGNLPVHMSVNKNLAAKMCKGDILLNLDGDNVLGPWTIEYVRSKIEEDRRAVIRFLSKGTLQSGITGRIAMHRKVFEDLGGYDEQFAPRGSDDLDLLERAKAIGCRIVTAENPWVVGLTITTPRHQSLQYICPHGKRDDIEPWGNCLDAANRHRSEENIRQGRLKANQGPPMYRLDDYYDIKYYRQAARWADIAQLANVIYNFFQPKSLIDMGCGDARLIANMPEHVVVQGVEGSAYALQVCETDAHLVAIRDLRYVFEPLGKFDLVTSIEVAEHIEPDYAPIYVQNLVQHGDRVLVSAAMPNQAGTQHVNCRHKRYWIELFAKHGFQRQEETERELKELLEDFNQPKLVRNLILFEKQEQS